jgi:hypothetical protein
MNKFIVPLSALALFGTLGSPARAVTVTADPGAHVGLIPGGVYDFSGQTPVVAPATGPAGNFSANGIQYSGGGIIANTTAANQYALPAGYSGNYMALLGGQQEVLTFGGRTMDLFGLFWGSIDSYNSIAFLLNGKVVGTYVGSSLAAPIAASGDQTGNNSNAYVTFNFGVPSFDEVILASADNSFEFTNVAAAAPEPATWAMMILGFIAVGFVSYRRSRPGAGLRAA